MNAFHCGIAALVLALLTPGEAQIQVFPFNERLHYAGVASFPTATTSRTLRDADAVPVNDIRSHLERDAAGAQGSGSRRSGPNVLPGKSRPRGRLLAQRRQAARLASAASISVKKLPVSPGRLAVGFNGTDAYTMRTCGTGPKYLNGNSFFKPPDVSGCVGSGYIVQVVNLAVSVYSATGKLLAGPIPTNQFFGLQRAVAYPNPTGGPIATVETLTDTSCIYDRTTQRFFMSLLWISFGRNSPWFRFGLSRPDVPSDEQGSAVVVAVSARGDPRKPWTVFLIPATNDGTNCHDDSQDPLYYEGAPFIGDYPQIGVDNYGVYVSTNQFGSSGKVGSNVYAIGKNALTAAVPKNSTILRLAIPTNFIDAGTFFPLQANADPTAKLDLRLGGTMWFSFLLPPSFLGVLALTNTSQLSVSSSRVQTLLASVQTLDYSAPRDPVTQRTGAIPFGATLGLTRVQPVMANTFLTGEVQSMGGTVVGGGMALWVVWTGGAAGSSDTGILVAKLLPLVRGSGTAALLTLSLGAMWLVTVPGQSLVFPALNVNGKGKGIVAAALIGPSHFPSAAYFTLDTTTNIVGPNVSIAAAGRFPLDQSDARLAGQPMRFGDFQMATIDETGNAWGMVEYVNGAKQYGPYAAVLTHTSWANWATFIFKVNL